VAELSLSNQLLYRSARVEIEECDWATLDVRALRSDSTARTMIVLDQGRVLLDEFDCTPQQMIASDLCTVFRFPGAEPGRSGRVLQLTPSVFFHFCRRRQALLTSLPAPESHAEEDSLALLRFADSARSLQLHPPQRLRRRPTKHYELVSRAQTIMLEAIDQPHPVHELGRKLGVSPFYLAHLFSRDVGASVHSYLLQVRLLTALDRLREGASDLSKLALELGFSHHSHFSALFRRAMDTSPKEARRMLTGNTAEALCLTTYRCTRSKNAIAAS